MSLRWIALLLLLASLPTTARAEVVERQILDAFDYPDDATARAVWTPVEGSQPVTVIKEPLAGRKGVRLPCDMTGTHRRAAWERAVSLDLTRADRFAFWFYVDDPTQMSTYFSFYFASGDGWYSASFAAEQGWQRIVLDKSRFGTEGTPAGWAAIKAIRFSAWKSKEAITFLAIDDLEAMSSSIVAVLGDLAIRGADQESDDARTIRAQAQMMSKLLTRLGLEAGVLGDGDVESGALRGRKVAIFPYNPRISEREAQAIEEFIAGGGKAMLFYQSPPRVLAALGLQATGWQKQEYEGQLAAIRLAPDIAGMPPLVRQSSWNITKVAPAAKNARVVGEWLDAKGNATGLPALAVSDAGAFMAHVLLSDDAPGKEQMMLALLGRFLPEVWPQAVQRALDESGHVGEFATLEALGDFIVKAARPVASAHLIAARGLLDEARRAAAQQRHVEALRTARQARQELAIAYSAAQPSKTNEIRAVWCHSAFGVAGMTWDEAIKSLADNGLNVVVPNMLWGGRAYYQSRVLPVDEAVATKGDQIAACVAAAKKYGVQVHVWKVNWNLSNAPKPFLEAMRAAGRTQKDPQGKDIDWLCPSHPANFELEQSAMLEVARNYEVDGIHFDYIRYPGPEGCYCEGCRERFQKAAGVTVANWPQDVIQGALRPQYLDFRRANITRLVKAVSEAARQAKPGIKLSAAVFRDWPNCRDSVGQDWASWVKNGYLDFVCPMNYTDAPRQFDTWVTTQLQATGHAIPFCPGVGVTLDNWTLPADQTLQQIAIARRQGADGFILFNYSPYVVTDILPALHAGATATPAKLPWNR